LSTPSPQPDPTFPRWAVLASLTILGASVGVWGLLGALACVAVGYFGLCLARPGSGLAWSFFFLPLADPAFRVAGISVQPFELLVWPACMIALGSAIGQRETLRGTGVRALAPLLVIGGYFVCASVLLWGEKAPLEIRMWGSATVFGLACYFKAADVEFQQNLPRAFAASALSLSLLAIVQHYFGALGFQGIEEPRDLLRLFLFGDRSPVRLANLTFDHFNSAGAYLTLVSGTLVGLVMSSKGTRMLQGALVAALIALYLTYSRGAAIAATAGILVAVYLVARAPWRFALAVGATTITVIGIFILLPMLLLSDYATTISLGARALIWQAYVQAWLTSPLFGLGPGNGFATAQFLSPFGDQYAAHNNFLYIAADFGLVGVLVLLYGLGMVILRALRMDLQTRRERPYVVGGVAVLVALFIHSMVDHTLVVLPYRVALFGVLAVSLRSSSPTLESAT
jgi:O-antigen ligase